MQNATFIISRVVAAACLIAMISGAAAAPLSPEDRYIATRDAAIAKITKLYDSKKGDDAAKVEESVSTDLLTQMKAILAEHDRKGFGPAKLNMDTFSRGDEGFGTLDGLRFAAELGINGEKVGLKDPRRIRRTKGHYHRHDADAVRTLAARTQGLVGQERQERAAADGRRLPGRKLLYPGNPD